MRDDVPGLIVDEISLKRDLPAEVKISETSSDVFILLD